MLKSELETKSPLDFNSKSKFSQLQSHMTFALMGLFWIPFLFSAGSYAHFSWHSYLFYSRIVLFAFPFLISFIGFLFRLDIRNFISWYYILAMCNQAVHGSLEPSNQNDFYSYVSLFLMLNVTGYTGTIKKWLLTQAPFVIMAHLAPLAFKDKLFFSSIGGFVDRFTLNFAFILFSIILLQITTSRSSLIKKNELLHNSLLDEQNKKISLSEDALKRAKIEIQKLAEHKAMAELAAQVAHDIRSPLAALENMLVKITDLPESERILTRMAVNRIKDIANNLIESNRAFYAQKKSSTKANPNNLIESVSTELLLSLIDPLITEKRMQFRSKIGIEIDSRMGASSYGLFAKVQTAEFKRVLSNLINNSVEALPDKGNVMVDLAADRDQVRICVSDNGKGIPSEILAKLGHRGETHGKAEGSGLGLHHARTSIEKWGGRLAIESELGEGTIVAITLPKAEAPSWFVSELRLVPGTSIIVLDDDSSIHGIWQGRFDSIRVKDRDMNVTHLSTPSELRKWVSDHPSEAKSAVYLTDYELIGHRETGLDLIRALGLGHQSILVTSRYEDKQILEMCESLSVKLIPKGMAGLVPISVENPLELANPVFIDDASQMKNHYDLCLIDDDTQLIHPIWRSAASAKGLKIGLFSGGQEFLSAAATIEKKTPIYIDVSLGHDASGIDLAQAIYRLGFNDINLATGYEAHSIAAPPFIRRIVGKDFPEIEPTQSSSSMPSSDE